MKCGAGSANMIENVSLYRHNVDIYQDSTWWLGTFIMGYCNSAPSGKHFHGIHRPND